MELVECVDLPLIASLLLLVILLYLYGTWTFTTWSKQGIRGPKPYPFVGFMLTNLSKGSYNVDLELKQEYGKVVGVYQGRRPALLISDPELIRKVFIQEFNAVPNRISANRSGITNLILTSLTDDHWRHVRSAISPTFTSGKLKQMQQLIFNCSDRLCNHLMAGSGKPFNCKEYCASFALDTIASTAFGIETDGQSNPDDPLLVHSRNLIQFSSRKPGFIANIKLLFTLLSIFMLPQWLYPLAALLGFTSLNMNSVKYFQQLTNNLLKNPPKHGFANFVQICSSQLMNDPKHGDAESYVDYAGFVWSLKGLTRDEVCANAVVFILAGSDTTSSALQFILYELAMNPEIQSKLYAECEEISSEDRPSYDELSRMEYLEWMIKETLRLYPAIARNERSVSKEITVDGITIPAGSVVSAMAYAVHMDPDIWPDPTRFDPNRFRPESSRTRHSCAWLPFGVGNRNCIGMRLALLELKIAVVVLIRKFRFEPCATTPNKPIKFARSFVIQPVIPIELIAVPRQE